jgi:anti-sigma28 factor (negative regulator of flagellin synthesis)
MEQLARQVDEGSYRVDPRRVAEAIVSSVRTTGHKR